MQEGILLTLPHLLSSYTWGLDFGVLVLSAFS